MIIIQKRRETRFNVEIQTSIKKIVLNNREIISPNKVFPACIVNMSASGTLLKSPLSVPQNLKFIFDLMDEETKILCYLEIIRKETYADSYYYGCKLKTVFEIDRDKLRIFILKKQVENLKGVSNG